MSQILRDNIAVCINKHIYYLKKPVCSENSNIVRKLEREKLCLTSSDVTVFLFFADGTHF